MRRAACLLLFGCIAAIVSPAQTFTTLYSFCSQNECADGDNAFSTLVQGTDGNFYGTTNGGGNLCPGFAGCGTVFKVTPAGELTTLYRFDFKDGLHPGGGLAQGADGNFYGTTVSGGTSQLCHYGCGTVFKITPEGTLTLLHSFHLIDGANVFAGLFRGTDGSFYGTTEAGGASNKCPGDPNKGCGTVFKITSAGALTPLHSFDGTDGWYVYAGLVQGADGNFYGETYFGGASRNCHYGCGTVFKITPEGALITLHSFDNTDGELPAGGLVQATDGNFYGTTGAGGANASGTVFRITPEGTLTSLYSFCAQYGCSDGGVPNGGLLQATDGNLYGTTIRGGAYGVGTVFNITLGGTLTTLHNFQYVGGTYPFAGLVQDKDGNFYGTTTEGGAHGYGTIFKLSPPKTLAVTKHGNGLVISGDDHIYCGNVCSYSYIDGTQVGLTAIPAPGYTFIDWTGCDNVNGTFCSLTMSAAKNVTATFTPANAMLTSLTFKPSYVKGGQLSAGTLTLSRPAPPGGLGVGLSSDHPNVAHPPSMVVVSGGKTSVSFAVNTFPVKMNTTVMITATAGSSQVSGKLTVGTSYYSRVKTKNDN
jgi:uncharacterized repeat protein (TIGR03803 family)